jgi:hypothetical protein
VYTCTHAVARNPRTEIPRARWKPPLASPPGGPEEVVLQTPGYGGGVIGGKTSDWYRMLYSDPPITGGQNTHTHRSIACRVLLIEIIVVFFKVVRRRGIGNSGVVIIVIVSLLLLYLPSLHSSPPRCLPPYPPPRPPHTWPFLVDSSQLS